MAPSKTSRDRPISQADLTPVQRHLADGSEFDPSAGGAKNLGTLWRRAWQANPDAQQIHDPVGRWHTRGDLERESERRAGRLSSAGLGPGDRILVSAQSSIDLVLSYIAAIRMGLVVIPTNTAYGERELRHVVSDARPRAAIVDSSERRAALARADSELLLASPALEFAEGATPQLDCGEPESPALICYTSGTTGAPKGAVLSHANCLASAEGLRLAWRWSEADRLLLALPLFHMHGLGVGLHGTLATGGSAVLHTHFQPDAILADIVAHDATLFFGVPTMYHRLASHPEATALSGLRLCVSGSAPLPASLHEQIHEVCGQRVLERYGMTETLMLVSNPFEGERRPGAVGFPLPGVELRLQGDPEEIQARGANVFEGYWERPDANREAFTDDGWFRTGDLGARDEDGYLRIVGRAKELIISGGYNVYPREVEDVLRLHPSIEDVAIVGEPSPEWGERVAAYITLAERDSGDQTISALGVDALRAWIGDRLAPFKHPRSLFVIDALPRNALGKVQKHRLVEGVVVDD